MVIAWKGTRLYKKRKAKERCKVKIKEKNKLDFQKKENGDENDRSETQ